MLKRKALIIANPGEQDEENYCEGVYKDVTNYESFLKSPLGGLWYPSEIIIVFKPTVFEVNLELLKLKQYDYSLVIFTGHGYYSNSKKSTIIALKEGEEMDSKNLFNGSKKQTLVLDCCRKVDKNILTEVLERSIDKIAKSIDPSECRIYYDKYIEECNEAIVVLYSCDIDEYAGDDSRNGGYYSYNLISASKEWSDSNNFLDGSYYIFSVVCAHNKAVVKTRAISRGYQNPQIEKPRSGNYFPFAIVV